MKKLFMFLCIGIICSILACSCNQSVSAKYYREQYPVEQDTLNNVLDFKIDIDPMSLSQVTLRDLTLYPECEMESPDGSSAESVEQKIDLKNYRQKLIANGKSTILRVYDTQDLGEDGTLYPYYGTRSCVVLYSGTLEIKPRVGGGYTKDFSITRKEFEPVTIKVAE